LDFIKKVAHKNLLKTSHVAQMKTTRVIYDDWNEGKIPFHTLPPQDPIPDEETDEWINLNMNQIIQTEKVTVLQKIIPHENIIFTVPINSMNLPVDPAWLKIDRTPDDLLNDIIEEMSRRRQKKKRAESKEKSYQESSQPFPRG